MEPKTLIVGKIAQIMEILADELNTNYGREVTSCASKNEVAHHLAAEEFDLVILGAGFDDETRDDVAAMIAESHPGPEVFLVPRVGEKSPAKLIALVNDKTIEWKFQQVLGPGPASEPRDS
ncbi:MAG: hypothetical protein ACRBK7_03635 [Acidimicrobiales bacterium]